MKFFQKKPPKKLTRLFFATDLHGSQRTFRKFVNAGKFYEANVIIMGGDILGKIAVPIIHEGNGHYRATLQGRTERVETEAELKNLLDKIGILGFYSKVLEADEFQAIQSDPAAIDALFHQLARERLEEWVELAETRLAGTGIKCFVTGGNDDYPDVLEALQCPGAQSIFGCEGQLVQVDDEHTMISMGFSGPTPWRTPREVPDGELGVMIEQMIGRVADMSHCIFNFHDPPVDSTLDTCPMLDWNTDPPSQIMRGGQLVLFGAGSASVRRAIETHQPLLGLHGHIHESPGVIKIGRTTCINPGSEYGEGILRGCLVTLSNGKVEGYQMTTG
ncbi:MAG: metallophosphoesterase [Anaerolineae bacterium]|nr:metallophosphoesterase [Anaerolineales bacterium]MCQ3972923.1 metallophosphoesterase [Anaerolineae bacterium]